MYAKTLEHILFYQLLNSDFSHEQAIEFQRRFEQLRSYSRLPKGRANRSRPLTLEQIADAIIGMATIFPSFAGHSSLVLSKLETKRSNSKFMGANTLQAAIIKLLSDKNARMKLIRVSISGAESGLNANGYAIITHEAGVSEYGWEPDYSSVARELVLRKSFFDKIAEQIDISEHFPSKPEGDGSEYDDEEARTARYKKLGVTRSSRFLNVGVDSQATWPRHETLITFDKYKFVLMPKTKDNTQSIHLDLHANHLTDREASTIINRFLSMMTWCCDQYAIKQISWSGNPVPKAVAKRDLAFATAYDWYFDRKIPSTNDQRRALALYREARNAEDNFLVSYAVLNYTKILEIKYSDKVCSWWNKNFDTLLSNNAHRETLKKFIQDCGELKPSKYLWKACRVAVAHVARETKSDPDDWNELSRLHTAANVLKIFARHFIEYGMGISDCLYSGT